MVKIRTDAGKLKEAGPVRHSNGSVGRDIEKLKNAGIMLLRDNRPRNAVELLEAFLASSPYDGQGRSYLGLAYAMSQQGKKGLRLCREAARSHPFDAEIHENLGRVYLMAGRRRMAWETFILAARLDSENDGIREDLLSMGKRRPPVIPSLSRSHPVNVYAGRLLKKIGLR